MYTYICISLSLSLSLYIYIYTHVCVYLSLSLYIYIYIYICTQDAGTKHSRGRASPKQKGHAAVAWMADPVSSSAMPMLGDSKYNYWLNGTSTVKGTQFEENNNPMEHAWRKKTVLRYRVAGRETRGLPTARGRVRPLTDFDSFQTGSGQTVSSRKRSTSPS